MIKMNHFKMKHLALLFLLAASLPVLADNKASMPSDADINAARARSQSVFDQAEQSAKNPSAVMPNVPMNNIGSQGIDIADLANQKRQTSGWGEPDDLLIFVSFSMPEATLRSIASQAAKAKAIVVFRGIPGGLTNKSWQAAMNRIKPLAATGANIQIDPEQFKRYDIQSVPSYVLALNNKNQKIESCSPEGCMAKSIKATGDASVSYVLEQWTSTRDKSLAKAAKRRLNMLEGT